MPAAHGVSGLRAARPVRAGVFGRGVEAGISKRHCYLAAGMRLNARTEVASILASLVEPEALASSRLINLSQNNHAIIGYGIILNSN